MSCQPDINRLLCIWMAVGMNNLKSQTRVYETQSDSFFIVAVDSMGTWKYILNKISNSTMRGWRYGSTILIYPKKHVLYIDAKIVMA